MRTKSGQKIIVRVVTGSKLYGTDTPESDLDIIGVFLPERRDLLGLENCPATVTENIKVSTSRRNTKDDIDCKYYSLRTFFEKLATGEPGLLELLFAPKANVIYSTPEWDEIVRNRDIFLSRRAVAPFTGFCVGQARKATIKGENLRKIRQILAWGEKVTIGRAMSLKEHGSLAMDAADLNGTLTLTLNDWGAPEADKCSRCSQQRGLLARACGDSFSSWFCVTARLFSR